MLKEKIKNTEAIGKAIELLVKVTDKEDDPQQIERLLNVIHELSGIHQESVSGMRNISIPQTQHKNNTSKMRNVDVSMVNRSS